MIEPLSSSSSPDHRADLARMNGRGLPPTWVLDQLPTGVLIVDVVGTVRYANRHMLAQLGWTADDCAGRSIFDHIVAPDTEFAATVIAEGPDYWGSVLGPMRMRYIDADGEQRLTEFWAQSLDDDSGYAIVIPEESVVDALGDAVQAIAHGEPIERAVELIAASFRVYPMIGDCCVLRVDDDRLEPMTRWPLDDTWWSGERSAPWHLAARSGLDVDINDVAEIGGRLGAELESNDYRSLWCRPVIGRRGEVSAVLVVFRPYPRPPSTNQNRRLDDIVAVASLAFDQLEYRSTLEQAAFTDSLTGASTRARLQQVIDDGIEGAAVLYLDLDGFKQINDRHGHGAGDRVLAEVAGRLEHTVRGHDLVVRVGGDEFLVVLYDTNEHDAANAADRVVHEVARPFVLIGADGDVVELTVGASVGVCVQTVEMSFDEAVRRADDALGSAKQLGKGRYYVAGDS